ncbi:uncharacterized protein LOC131622782 [Vicia villosa]|uniref:uncharacterized protein LOC131622782 n=1 Tax=Vicia villosa TaxID=3911 RepID=UPI00273B1A98|nr:uncharacterized protein LOC131622782 [Vicia villosa]XP_058749805.1 uncharacterized protein LOC131622782 [Vicia villosa]
MHEKTKSMLHSLDVSYGSSSEQQSVTGFPTFDDSNSDWDARVEFPPREENSVPFFMPPQTRPIIHSAQNLMMLLFRLLFNQMHLTLGLFYVFRYMEVLQYGISHIWRQHFVLIILNMSLVHLLPKLHCGQQ